MGVAIWSMSHLVATMLITHCNKGVKKDMAALDRVIGSIAWASTCRIAHIFALDADDPGQGVFLPMKSNIGPKPLGLTYAIRPVGKNARVEWLHTNDLDADAALSGERKKSRGVVAVEWLAERFREQRRWRSDELTRDALEAGLSRNALWSPEVLGLPIRKRKQTNATGDTHWFWEADEGWPPAEKNPNNPE
jgi:hypothetical protein